MAIARKPTSQRSKGPAKRFPLNLRTTKELRIKLERSADKSGRSLVQEVEHRLDLADWLIEQVNNHGLIIDDVLCLRTYVAFIQRAIAEAGEAPDRWRDYTCIPMSWRLDYPPNAQRAYAMVAEAVRNAYRESKAFLAEHGNPPPRNELHKHLPGTRGPDAWAQHAITLEHADRAARIEANAPDWLPKG